MFIISSGVKAADIVRHVEIENASKVNAGFDGVIAAAEAMFRKELRIGC